MDELKKGFREGKTDAKEGIRDADGTSPADALGNLGDEARKNLGNAGDDLRRGSKDAERETNDEANRTR